MKTSMKWFCIVLLILGFIWAVPAQVLPGKQIGQYPNKATPGSTDLFIMEQASPKTNVNISAFQLKNWVTSGLAQASFNTNILATTNYVVTAVTGRVFVAAGSTNVGIVTNFGSGTVTYTVYATNDGGGGGSSAIATNAVTGVWSNDVNVATPATNINFWFLSTAGVSLTNRSGLVDVRLATLSAVDVTNLINTIINFLPMRTNQFTTNLNDTPVVGQLWLSGTNGFINTNGAGARLSAVEWNPMVKSLRVGALQNQTVFAHHYLNTSNYWDTPNLGKLSIGFGSNTLVNADFSSVLGGYDNLIYTNASNSVIVGGSGNSIRTNSNYSFIGSGRANIINVDCGFGTIAGGSANVIFGGSQGSTISGGSSCQITGGDSVVAGGNGNNVVGSGASFFGTVSGGNLNVVRSASSTIGGGHNNIVYDGGTGGTVAGGGANIIGTGIGTGSTYSFIGGGNANQIHGAGSANGYSVIVGGRANTIVGSGGYSFIGGGVGHTLAVNVTGGTVLGSLTNTLLNGASHSTAIGWKNEIGATNAMTIGYQLTNSAVNTIDLGSDNINKITVDTNGMNFRGVTNLVAGTITNLHRYVGRVRLASGQSTYFITNNLVTVNTILMATLNSDCGTILSNAVPTAGLITIKTLEATTANADISFQILTP